MKLDWIQEAKAGVVLLGCIAACLVLPSLVEVWLGGAV